MPTTGDDSDRLGRRGETELDRLALEAGLEPAKLDPDRIGIDRIISFPIGSHDQRLSLDKRPPARQALMQIKTVSSKKRSAVVALDKAERLAKELKPSIICIIRADENGTFRDMYFVHLSGAPLGRILRRLRQHHKGNSRPLHKATISVNVSDGVKVELSAAGVLAALGGIVPPDMLAYAGQKQRELETLGYTNERYRVAFKLGGSIAELQDTLLGERPLTLENLETFERRFDVELPASLPGMENAGPDTMLRLSYEVSAPVSIAISSNLAGTATFQGVARAAAPIDTIPDDERKIIVENDAFRVVARQGLKLQAPTTRQGSISTRPSNISVGTGLPTEQYRVPRRRHTVYLHPGWGCG